VRADQAVDLHPQRDERDRIDEPEADDEEAAGQQERGRVATRSSAGTRAPSDYVSVLRQIAIL
jgi:hypothetical protein